MSVGPIGGVLGSAAGAPLAQTKGSETERSRSESASQSRTREANEKSEQASGIGQTQEDQGASERDADGRRLWEGPPEAGDGGSANENDAQSDQSRRNKDATGQAGGQLDLLG